MYAAGRIRSGRVAAMAPVLALCCLAACATIEAPRGGPEDHTPPEVAAVTPDSGAVGLVGVDRIEIAFSEKVTPSPAERFLRVYPPLEVKKTKWRGRRRATVIFQSPLPADTVIVIEIPKGHADVHRVKSVVSRRYPLATAPELPAGRITGTLSLEDAPAAGAVVELYDVPPDTLEWFRQDPLRRTEADSTGAYVLDWLVAPGGPYLLRAFVDDNGDLRPADSEAQRLLPVEVALTPEAPTADAGAHVLYDPRTPGRLLGILPTDDAETRALFGWTAKVAEADTGFVPDHVTRSPESLAAVVPGDTTIFEPAGPGPVRAIVFADLDGDSLLSALPDSAAVPDTVLWRWEPYAVVDTLEVEPGLELETILPAPGDSLRPCLVAPSPRRAPRDTSTALTDSLMAPALRDSLAAIGDSLVVQPDSLAAPAPPDTATGGDAP